MRSFIRTCSQGAALALGLSACVPAGMSGSAPRAIAVSGGAVTVAGPQGYCVDRSASRDGASGAFVLLGSCASISGNRAAGQPPRPAILTVSVGPAAASGQNLTAALPGMADFFRTTPGRAALSGAGRADTVTVERISAAGGVLFIRLSDSAVAAGQPVEPGHWRALTAIRGRVVTLAVLSPDSAPLTASEQRTVLDAFVARMRAANPETGGATAQG